VSGFLISPAEVRDRLGGDDLALLEVSFKNSDASYRSAHLPGARWAYWKALLWDELRREFAAPEVLAERLGAYGVRDDQTLVVYGDPVQFGTYALWVLQAGGQRDVRVLDGGKEHWIAAGLPLTTDEAELQAAPPRPYGPQDRSSIVGRDVVLQTLQDGNGTVILDLRSPEEYSGERVSPYDLVGTIDHGAERSGRIPGARHLYYRDLLRDDHTLRPPEELRAALAERGVGPDDHVIAYCRLSHRASLGWLALTEVAGHRSVQVYDGSWTEWGSMVGMPIER
jgi:thiosulfate/3-mercaptopyruvate sulfurtransferase